MPHVHFPTEPPRPSPQDQKLDAMTAELKYLKGAQVKCNLRTPICPKQSAQFFYELALFKADFAQLVAGFGRLTAHDTRVVFGERLRKLRTVKKLYVDLEREEGALRLKVPYEIWAKAVGSAERVGRAKDELRDREGGASAGEEDERMEDLMEEVEMVYREEAESEGGGRDEASVGDENSAQLEVDGLRPREVIVLDDLPDMEDDDDDDSTVEDDISDYGDLEVVESVTFVEFDGVLV